MYVSLKPTVNVRVMTKTTLDVDLCLPLWLKMLFPLSQMHVSVFHVFTLSPNRRAKTTGAEWHVCLYIDYNDPNINPHTWVARYTFPIWPIFKKKCNLFAKMLYLILRYFSVAVSKSVNKKMG